MDGDRIDRLRDAASERWGASAAGADVDALAAALDAADPNERAEAAWALAELAADADPDSDRAPRLPVESALALALDDPDRWVRRGASWALALVADDRPERGRDALDAVVAALTDDDPLVRENAVLALGAVAAEYPYAVEPALSELAALAGDGDGLARRYAAETLHRLVAELDAGGFPETVVTTREAADLVPEDAGVVAVTDDGGDEPIRVRDDEDAAAETDEQEESDDADDRTLDDTDTDPELARRGPPDLIPSPPAVDADRRAFERLADLGSDPLTTAEKVRAPADGDHVVATLRTLRPDADADPDAVAAGFRAWAQIAGHDHVAPVLARGRNPRPWVATEFADGGTLRDAGDVGLDRALWYVDCVTRAVCHAHARGVVHGALRPGAVGLSRTLGAWPVPKVGDWGLGEAFDAVASPPVPPAFAAPEHLAPERFGGPDHATDVYQLGALSYALVAGRPPFAGDDVARRVCEEPPDPASAYAPDVPPAVDDLLGRALAKEKAARFETAEDFRRGLELAVADRD